MSKTQITEKNCRVADKVLEALDEGKCTVSEACDILYDVEKYIKRFSTVQIKEKYADMFSDELGQQEQHLKPLPDAHC